MTVGFVAHDLGIRQLKWTVIKCRLFAGITCASCARDCRAESPGNSRC